MLTDNASAACADNGAPQGHRDGEAERSRRKRELKGKRMSRPRDDGRIKTEQQAAERPNNRASPEVSVQSRMPFSSRPMLTACFLAVLNEPARFESHKVWLAPRPRHASR